MATLCRATCLTNLNNRIRSAQLSDRSLREQYCGREGRRPRLAKNHDSANSTVNPCEYRRTKSACLCHRLITTVDFYLSVNQQQPYFSQGFAITQSFIRF